MSHSPLRGPLIVIWVHLILILCLLSEHTKFYYTTTRFRLRQSQKIHFIVKREDNNFHIKRWGNYYQSVVEEKQMMHSQHELMGEVVPAISIISVTQLMSPTITLVVVMAMAVVMVMVVVTAVMEAAVVEVVAAVVVVEAAVVNWFLKLNFE